MDRTLSGGMPVCSAIAGAFVIKFWKRFTSTISLFFSCGMQCANQNFLKASQGRVAMYHNQAGTDRTQQAGGSVCTGGMKREQT